MSDQLLIQNFAHLANVDLTFGDLTVVVGAQGTGKSLALQWLKTAIDGPLIVKRLQEAGHHLATDAVLIDLVFGVGMAPSWRDDTRVTFNGKSVTPSSVKRRRAGEDAEKVFFVPAHRALLISDGWAAPFQKLTAETPAVARIFSEHLFKRFSDPGEKNLFPVSGKLKEEIRRLIDQSVFHAGQVGLKEDEQHAKRLRLTHGDVSLPFMTWTAGQREFTPLLLGLDHLVSSRNKPKRPDVDWVVVEEPEMGLHPAAITAVMLLVLELLSRGYRVVLSTHSPHVLSAVWMLKRLQENKARWRLVADAFGVQKPERIKAIAESALTKRYNVFHLAFGEDGLVRSSDVSGLDPGSENDDESGWGGLTEFTSRFGEAVARAVNEAE